MEIILCDRCGRKTKNGPAFLLPDKDGIVMFGKPFGTPIVLCNNCLKDFDTFRLEHDRFNTFITIEDSE
jgi:hypothetical protein